MQASYRHRQVSRPTVVSFIVLTVLLSLPFFFVGPHLVLFAAIAPIFALVALVHWLVYSMTVEVAGQELRWHSALAFGESGSPWPTSPASSAFAYHGGTASASSIPREPGRTWSPRVKGSRWRPRAARPCALGLTMRSG